MSATDHKAQREVLVLVTSLQEIYTAYADQIYQAVLLSNAVGPSIGSQVFQTFRLSDTFEWVAYNIFNKLENSKSYFAIILYPELQIINELRLKDSLTLFTRPGRPRP